MTGRILQACSNGVLRHIKISKQEIDENSIDSNNILNGDSEIKIEVLNGSGSTSKLNEAVSDLKALGIEVAQIGNTSTTNNTTIINRNNIPQSKLETIMQTLGSENVDSGSSNSNIDATIIIGTDYVM